MSAATSPNGVRLRPRISTEIAILVGVFALYKAVRFLVRDDAGSAYVNARRIVDLERMTGLWTEPGLQSLVLKSTLLIEGLNWFYARIHLVSTAAVLVFLFIVDANTYRWLRRRLVAVTLIALVIHLVFPLAPPRLVGATDMIDTLQQFGPAIYQNDSTLSRIANPRAAMPSLHFGYALLLALALARRGRPWLRSLWMLHPVVMAIAIVATANHYWLDAIVVAVVVAVVDRVLSRREVGIYGRPMRLPLPTHPVECCRLGNGFEAQPRTPQVSN